MKLKQLREHWNSKDTNQKPNPEKGKKRLPWNIYHSKTPQQHYQKFHRIHFWFKNKLLSLALYLSQIVIGKHNIDHKPPQADYNTNLQIFNDSWEQSIIDWNVLYRRNGGLDEKRKTKKWWTLNAKKDGSCNTLRGIKNIGLTVVLNDTSYREFFTIWMHNQTRMMIAEYTNKKKYPDGVGHLFYAEGGMYDVDYKILFKQIQTRTMHELKAQLRNPEDENKQWSHPQPPPAMQNSSDKPA